mmetsp:Transcript_3582/g.7698  ORF Transcript_3582/g.7698 Transcript_3582/m.7698 type:complete len:325 (-) Transcript_3582:389-1363(-)
MPSPGRLGEVVREGVGVLQDAAAFNKLLIGCLEELHIRPGGPVRPLLEQHHALLSLAQLPFGEFLSLSVGMVALVVVQVAVQLPLGLGRLGHVGLVIVGVVLVAAVITPRVGPMVIPIAHADPAELVPALLARHVVAPLVLLNAGRALGAGFGVGQDPVGGFRLVAALLGPPGQVPARHGGVRLLTTPQAEASGARVTLSVVRRISSKPAPCYCDPLAPRAWAPPCHLAALHETPQLVGLELPQQVWRRLPHLLLRHNLPASGLGACLADTKGTGLKGALGKTPPALTAKLVAAGHAEHLGGVEAVLIVADEAFLLVAASGCRT